MAALLRLAVERHADQIVLHCLHRLPIYYSFIAFRLFNEMLAKTQFTLFRDYRYTMTSLQLDGSVTYTSAAEILMTFLIPKIVYCQYGQNK